MKIYKILFTLFLTTVVASAQAQFRNNQFGKNRVQYKRMEWRFISTQNFDIYFYDGGYDVAKEAAKYAEDDFDRITDLVGFSPYNKTKILIYNSVTDLHQSNIGVYYQSFEIGGQTNFVRSEIEVAFDGNKAEFKRELALSIADILIFEMMYGGNLKEIFQNSYLLNLPEWFMAGAASYIAHGWSVEMDDYIRDMFQRKRFKKISNLEGRDARLLGQSIWNYIAEEYGKSNIANILNLTRIVRNEEQSIQQTLGVSFKTFIKGWRAYYERQYQQTAENHKVPEESQIMVNNKRKHVLNQVRISPNGKYMAYTHNNRGRYKVKLRNLQNGKEKTLFTGGYKLINQKVNRDMPIIAWRDNNELSFFAAKNGNIYLYFHKLWKKRNKKEKRLFKSFSNIKSYDVSENGNNFILSGEWRGKSDLYLYDYRQRKLTQITNDPYDYQSPAFLDDAGKKIIFSSNRKGDTLKVVKEVEPEAITDNFNIFVYDVNNPNVLRRVTNTLSKDTHPEPLNENEVVYLSDQRGIKHLYKYNLEDSISIQVTNYQASIQDFDVHNDDLYMIMLYKGINRLFEVKNVDFDKSTFTGKTYRQQMFDLRNLQALKKKRQEEERRQLREEEARRRQQEQEKLLEEIRESSRRRADSLQQLQDSLGIDLSTPDTLPTPAGTVDVAAGTPPDSVAAEQQVTEEVDTDNYRFDTFSKGRRQSFLERYKSRLGQQEEEENQELNISKSQPYEKMFAADNFVTSLVIDPLRNWGLLFEVAMTDVLENHKINAGIFYVTDLNNSNLFAEYEYLRNRFDYRGRYVRNNLERRGENAGQKYSMNYFEGSVSYPFNITSRVSIEPFFANTRYTATGILNLGTPDEVVNYAGFNAEFIYDNSIITGTNMLQGTRFRARYESYNGLGEAGQGRSFGKLVLDLRHYQKLHRSLILATRLSYGQFTGQDKKNFILGGMDNWMFNQFDEGGEGDPLASTTGNNSDLLFVEFVTPLRGFNFNKLYGNNYMLFNAELRLPLLKYFAKGTITSNFFRNLQLVGFTDIGSSWTGVSPFNRENALNTETITRLDGRGYGFRATVKNFKNPFLIGYGAGIRTMLLGYYAKLDVAWGLEDNVRQDAKFYLTLGYDF